MDREISRELPRVIPSSQDRTVSDTLIFNNIELPITPDWIGSEDWVGGEDWYNV